MRLHPDWLVCWFSQLAFIFYLVSILTIDEEKKPLQLFSCGFLENSGSFATTHNAQQISIFMPYFPCHVSFFFSLWRKKKGTTEERKEEEQKGEWCDFYGSFWYGWASAAYVQRSGVCICECQPQPQQFATLATLKKPSVIHYVVMSYIDCCCP